MFLRLFLGAMLCLPLMAYVLSRFVTLYIDLLTDYSLVAPSNSLNTVAGSWTKSESGKSSTWRELEAVSRTVKSSFTLLKNQFKT